MNSTFFLDALLMLVLAAAAPIAPLKVVGYVDAQSQQSLPIKRAPLEDLTHVVLSNAVKVDSKGKLHFRPRRFPWENSATELMQYITARESSPALIVSLRGFPDDTALDQLAELEDSRSNFVDGIATMLKERGASGVELEWHADDMPGGKARSAPFDEPEQIHFSWLCKDLSAALRPLGKTLSVAVRPGRQEFDSGGPVRDFVDWLSVRAYSMRSLGDPHHSSVQDAETALNEWRARGVEPAQLVLISPLFARPGAALRSHSRDASLRRPWHEMVDGGLKAVNGEHGDIFVEPDTKQKWWASGFNTTKTKVQRVIDGGYGGVGFRDLHHDSHEEADSLLQLAVHAIREHRTASRVPSRVQHLIGLSLLQRGARRSKAPVKDEM